MSEPKRSGLKAWHNAPCGWCESKATGDALFRAWGLAGTYSASCGKHGEDFKSFAEMEAQQ